MKPAVALKKYYEKRIDSISTILSKGEEKFSAKDFHKLRINIKKVRTILSLLNYSSKKFKKNKYFKLYNKVFKQAGKVRDLQLEESTLDKLERSDLYESYIEELTSHRKKSQEKFFSLTNKKLTKKIGSVPQSIILGIKRLTGKKVKNFLNRKRKNVDRALKKKKLKKERLHKLRKKLKDYYNIIKIFPPKDKRVKKSIKNFEELLGNWHDQVVISGHIKNVIDSDNFSPEELESINKVRKEIYYKSEKLLEEISLKKEDVKMR